MISIRSLCKSYGEKQVLKSIDLDVAEGQVFAIIGPSGSGKTTLLRLIDLLERPTSGSVLIDGLDANASEHNRLTSRRKMAIVFQRPVLFQGSVSDNVAYGLMLRKTQKNDIQSKVARALESVGLSEYRKRNARTLSGGEAQRVALARAIVLEPRVLLLDEPTANLDPVSTANAERLISSVIKELKTTVIISTHDMAQGQRLAHRIGVILEGQMLQTGTPYQIFSRPRYRDIAELVGVENIFEGAVAANDGGMVDIKLDGHVIEGLSDLRAGASVYACIRPEEVTLSLSKLNTSARNSFKGKVNRIDSNGPLARVEIDCGFRLVALITRRSSEEMGLHEGSEVSASFKASGVHVIARD